MMKEELVHFLLEIVIKISESDSDTKVIYPLLQDNLDKLSLNFAESLRHWTKNYFAEESSYKAAQAVAGIIGNFGVLIAQFPHGNIANNLDIAIACYEVIEIIFNFNNFPEFWATSKMNLGSAYGERIYGDQIENLEKALLAYQDALKVYSYEEFPLEWAKTQNNRVSFYIKKN